MALEAFSDGEIDVWIREFRDRHAILLTEIRRMELDDSMASRRKELKGILKVVARDFMRQHQPEFGDDELIDWLERLEAA